jgi:hypothetical protein
MPLDRDKMHTYINPELNRVNILKIRGENN